MKFKYIAKNPTLSGVSRQVPGAGLEPARHCCQRILTLLHCRRESTVLSHYITIIMRLVVSLPPGMTIYQALLA